jgi:hypothetical protein
VTDPEILVGLTTAIRPVEATVDRVTVPANPFVLVREIVEVRELP